jgi:hypothetical protein
MSKKPLPEGNSRDETESSLSDEEIFKDGETLENVNDFSEGLSHAAAGAFGAQAAFLLGSEEFPQLQDSNGELSKSLANFQSIAASFALPKELIASFQSIADSFVQPTISTEALAGIREAVAAQVSLPEGFLDQFLFTRRVFQESDSLPDLYLPSRLTQRGGEQATVPRDGKTAESFFDENCVNVSDVDSFMDAISVIQKKQYMHNLVWRGQQDVAWGVHSSLYRKLEKSGLPSEDRFRDAEMEVMEHAKTWGLKTLDPLRFLADLQHRGAPTRLLDVTLDPEVAAWFATESSPESEEPDGRVIAWGRKAPTTTRKFSEDNDELSQRDSFLFWHSWVDNNQRAAVGWGTGSRTWPWFPPAISDRMRAQRSGFLLEAAPLYSQPVAEVISKAVSGDWRAEEITRATSIVGLPSRHDVLTEPNEANLVPLFSLRIAASAKSGIRQYLESKGLSTWSVYPDREGLVDYLKGPFGITK